MRKTWHGLRYGPVKSSTKTASRAMAGLVTQRQRNCGRSKCSDLADRYCSSISVRDRVHHTYHDVAELKFPRQAGSHFALAPDAGDTLAEQYIQDYAEAGFRCRMAQGVGWALNKKYFFARRHLLDSSLLDYNADGALDLPMIDTVMVEVESSTRVSMQLSDVADRAPAAAVADAVCS